MSEFAKVSWTNLHNERGRINPETIEFPKETLTEMYSSVINRLDKNRAIAEQMFYNAAQHNPYILEKIGAFSISSEEIELEVVQKVKKLVESQALQGLKEYVGFTTAVSEEIKKSEELSRHLEICKAVAEAEDSISEIQHALDTYPETREDLLRKFTQLIPSPQLLRITRVSTQYEMICHQLVNFCIVHSNEDDEFILNLFLSIPDCFSRLETTSQTSDNKLSCALLLLKALKRSPHGGNLDSFKSIAQQLRLINGIIYNIPYKTQQKDLANLISEWESSDTVCQSDAEFSIFSRLISVSPLEEKPSKNIQKILWRMLWKISGLTVDPKIHFNLKLKYTVDQMYGESWAKKCKEKGSFTPTIDLARWTKLAPLVARLIAALKCKAPNLRDAWIGMPSCNKDQYSKYLMVSIIQTAVAKNRAGSKNIVFEHGERITETYGAIEKELQWSLTDEYRFWTIIWSLTN